MKFFKRHHSHLLVFFLIISVGVVWTLVLFSPKQVEVKENPDVGYVPGEPVNLQAEVVSENKINLTWQTPFVDETNFAPPESYVIYRSLTGNDFEKLSPIGTRSGSVNSYSDMTVEAGNTYYYKVAGRNTNGEGKNSNVATAVTPFFLSPPTGLVAESISDSEIKIRWDRDVTMPIDGYEIYRKKINENNFLLAETVGFVGEFLDSNLSANTTYVYTILAKKDANKSVLSENVQATTPSSTTPIDPPIIVPPPDSTPPIISQIQIVPGNITTKIIWDTNEPANGKIVYGEDTSYGFEKNNGLKTATHSLLLEELKPETVYHFKIFSTDVANLTSQSADATFTTLKKEVVVENVSNIVLSTSTQAILLNWNNPKTEANPDFEGVRIVRKIGSRPKTLTDGTVVYKGKNEVFIDKEILFDTSYYYTFFSYTKQDELSSGVSTGEGRVVEVKPAAETCDLAMIDCTKAACKKLAICKKIPNIVLPHLTSSSTTVSKLTIFDIDFLVKNDQLKLTPNQNMIAGFGGEPIKFVIAKNKLPPNTAALSFHIGKAQKKDFIYDKIRNIYYINSSFPDTNGLYETKIIIQKEKNKTEEISFLTESVAMGSIIDKKNQKQIDGAKVQLFDENGQLVDLGQFEQNNPSTTNGTYGWFVPNGIYYIDVAKEGYETPNRSLIVISNNLINLPLILSEKKKPIILTKLPEISNSKIISIGNLLNRAINPLLAGLALTLLVLQVPIFNIFAFLRLFFLQPILLIGSRKREAWGEVYNSLNKMPVDLAVVRLINNKTGKLVQSVVTSKNGKYYFKAIEGMYRMEVVKHKMIFPSMLLKNYRSDGRKTDLYHGHPFHLKDQYPLVNANIPGDPEVEIKTLWRIRLEKIARIFQYLLSICGIIITAYSAYLDPTIISTWILLIVHILVFLLFYRLAIPPKPKEWGTVYDMNTKKTLSQTIVRLFNIQFNKLVAMQTSDHRGRYYFLAGDSQYQLSFEKKEYELAQSEVLNLVDKEAVSVAVNMPLKKKNK